MQIFITKTAFEKFLSFWLLVDSTMNFKEFRMLWRVNLSLDYFLHFGLVSPHPNTRTKQIYTANRRSNDLKNMPTQMNGKIKWKKKIYK